MTQPPVSILPGAPLTDGAGLAGETIGGATEGGGDATSAFASLLTALQSGEAVDTDAMSALGLVVTESEVEGESTTESPAADVQMPAGLAALVQSLVAPRVAVTATETPIDGEAVGDPTVTQTTPAGVEVVEITTALPLATAPNADATTVPAADSRTALASAATTPVVDLTADIDGAPIEVEAPAAAEVAGDDIAEATDIEATETSHEGADMLETLEIDLPETEPNNTSETVDVDTADADAASRSDAGDTATTPDETTDQPVPRQAATADDTGSTADSGGGEAAPQPLATTATSSPSAASPAPAQPTTPGAAQPAAEQLRVGGAEDAGQAMPADVDATVATTATGQTAPTANTERADAPVIIERMTLREMPTVVVDRVRAVDPQGGMNRAVVRLDPPELGRIMLEIVSNGDEISVIARADNAEAARALIRQRAEIEAAVEALGLTVSDFDVQADDRERDDAEPEARRDGGFDDRGAAADARYVTDDLPATEGELFL